jgi:hypothetical protein
LIPGDGHQRSDLMPRKWDISIKRMRANVVPLGPTAQLWIADWDDYISLFQVLCQICEPCHAMLDIAAL